MKITPRCEFFSRTQRRASEAKCFLPRKDRKGKEGSKKKKGSHLREEGRLSFSRRLMTVRQFSSTADVTQTYTPLSLPPLCHPPPPRSSCTFPPLPLLITSLSCLSVHFSVPSSTFVLSLFFSSELSVLPPLHPPPLLLLSPSLSALSGDEWVE